VIVSRLLSPTPAMSLPKVTYFAGMEGRGEAIRLALAIGGIEFEDIGINHADWPTVKAATPFGTVPNLEWEGKVLGQSNAILRFVGKKAGLYPVDDWEAAKVDELLELAEDIAGKIVATFGKSGDEVLSARQKLSSEILPFYLARMDKIIASNGGKFYVGKLTVADLKLTGLCRWISSGRLDHVPTDLLQAYPNVLANMAAVAENPAVAAFRTKMGRK